MTPKNKMLCKECEGAGYNICVDKDFAEVACEECAGAGFYPKNKDKEQGGALRFDDCKPDYTHIHPLVWDVLHSAPITGPTGLSIRMLDSFMDGWYYYNTPISPLGPVLAAIVKEATPVLEFGAKKYAAMNYVLGMKFSRVMKSYRRHGMALIEGDELDAESGLSHLGHMCCNLLFAMTYDQLEYGCGPLDDRVLLVEATEEKIGVASDNFGNTWIGGKQVLKNGKYVGGKDDV